VERICRGKISGAVRRNRRPVPDVRERMRRALLSLPAVAAVLLLSGCGDPTPTEPGTGPGGTPSAVPTSPATPRPIPPVDPTKPGDPTRPGDPTGRPITVDGVVEAGVEPGCKVLTAAGTQYELLGENIPLGVPVRVTGVLQPGVLTTCQQGTPMRVTKVQRR
jgi:hypothetical protein